MMTKETFAYPSRDQRTQLHAVRWIPEGGIRGVVQICHGLFADTEQYDEFATFLADNGYLVVGHDMLGFGKSVTGENGYGYFTEERGNECLLTDIRNLFLMTNEKYEDKPYFLFGQGMGSVLAQQYITIFGDELNGVILSGTMRIPPSKLRSLKWKTMFAGKSKGWNTENRKLCDAMFADAAALSAGGRLSVNALHELLRAIEWTQNKMYLKKMAKSIPILIIGGKKDPMTHGGDDLRTMYILYLQNHVRDVVVKLYPDDRRDLLTEENRHAVAADILTWLDARAARGR